MWYYQIVSEWGECLESGTFRDEEDMVGYCDRRMRQLQAKNWWAEYRIVEE